MGDSACACILAQGMKLPAPFSHKVTYETTFHDSKRIKVLSTLYPSSGWRSALTAQGLAGPRAPGQAAKARAFSGSSGGRQGPTRNEPAALSGSCRPGRAGEDHTVLLQQFLRLAPQPVHTSQGCSMCAGRVACRPHRCTAASLPRTEASSSTEAFADL